MAVANFKFMTFILLPAFVVPQMATNTAQAQSLKEQYRNQRAGATQPAPPASDEVRTFLREITTAERMIMREGRLFIIPRRTRKGYNGQVEWGYDFSSRKAVVFFEYGGYVFGRETRRANRNAIWRGNSLICADKGMRSKAITLPTPLGKVKSDGVVTFKSAYAKDWYYPLSHTVMQKNMDYRFEVNLKTQECFGQYVNKFNEKDGVFRCTMLTLGQARKGYKSGYSGDWAEDYKRLSASGSGGGSHYADCKVEPARDG